MDQKMLKGFFLKRDLQLVHERPVGLQDFSRMVHLVQAQLL